MMGTLALALEIYRVSLNTISLNFRRAVTIGECLQYCNYIVSFINPTVDSDCSQTSFIYFFLIM